MKNLTLKPIALCIAAALFIIGCSAPTIEEPSTPDFGKIKAEIQELENEWAAADNEGDISKIMSYLADDAITMPNDKPAISGKAAIQKDYEEGMAKRKPGEVVSYEAVEVFGSENQVTEIGKSITKDSTGNIVRTGKYVAVWEKRDGKYLLLRDIGNSDKKVE
jgi:ketosteroid isomerase-like protein